MTIKIKVESPLQIKSASYSPDNHQWDITMTGTGWPWMMKTAKVTRCPHCRSDDIIKNGKTSSNYKQQYKCLNNNCSHRSFILD